MRKGLAPEIGGLMLVGSHDAGAYRAYQGEGDNNLVTSAVFAQGTSHATTTLIKKILMNWTEVSSLDSDREQIL